MDCSVIIVSYNSAQFVPQCLDSILKNTFGINYEIIVVDNYSNDGTAELVQSKFSDKVKLLRQNQNRGFAAGCNYGISFSKGKYILLLNPDTLLKGNAIGEMVRFLEERFAVGIAGCKVLNSDGTLQLPCRRRFPDAKSSFFKLFGLSSLFPKNSIISAYEMADIDAGSPHEVDAVSGSFLMFRRELLDSVGYLDEDFFIFGEDLDFCYRAKMHGWRIMYNSNAEIVHYRGQSRVFRSLPSIIQAHRAMFLFYRKHYRQKFNFFINQAVYTSIFLRCLFLLLLNLILPKRLILKAN